MAMSIRTVLSRDNPHYKSLRQMATSAQARKKAGQTLLDGIHLCEAWLAHRGAPQLCVISESAGMHPEVVAIAEACQSLQTQVLRLSDTLFSPLSQVEHGIGVLFVIDTPKSPIHGRLETAAILLDNVQDPGNLGSILRTSAAAGMRRVYCGSGTVHAWSPRVLRAGMGAHFVLDIVESSDLQALIDSASVPVLATGTQAASALYDLDLRAPCAWLFGNEGRGVSPSLLQSCTRQVSIPQSSAIDSLNVAASVAICLFEQMRQQQKTP